MSKVSKRGFEPYTGRHLTSWLVENYRPTLLPQSDAVWQAYELPSGGVVVLPGPSAATRPIATGTARKIASSLGMSYHEFRTAIGHPLIKHSRPAAKAVKTTRPVGCTKREVLDRVMDVRKALSQVETAVRTGAPRDPAVYLALHQLLSSALADASKALNEITQTGARRAS